MSGESGISGSSSQKVSSLPSVVSTTSPVRVVYSTVVPPVDGKTPFPPVTRFTRGGTGAHGGKGVDFLPVLLLSGKECPNVAPNRLFVCDGEHYSLPRLCGVRYRGGRSKGRRLLSVLYSVPLVGSGRGRKTPVERDLRPIGQYYSSHSGELVSLYSLVPAVSRSRDETSERHPSLRLVVPRPTLCTRDFGPSPTRQGP